MKKLILLLAVTITASISSYAQWDTVHTGNTARFEAMDFVFRDTGTVVGYDTVTLEPKIMWTMFLGSMWFDADLDDSVTRPLHAVKFSADFHAVAVGDSGQVAMSSGDASNWTGYTIAGKKNLYAVEMRNSLYGWIAGEDGAIYRYTNGFYGQPDTLIYGPTTLPVRSICFISDSKGWLTGDGGVIATTSDSGNTWTLQTNPYFGFFQGKSISFSDANNGFCVGDGGRILRTTDGGANWFIPVIPNLTITADLHSVSYGTANGVVICGSEGLILQSTDGGWSWADQSISGQRKDWYCATWSGDSTAFVCGAYGKMAHSLNDISSVQEHAASNMLVQSFPNPFADQFQLQIDNVSGDVLIRVTDLSGHEIESQNMTVSGSHRMSIDGSQWASGMYFVQVNTATENHTLRVIKTSR